MQHERTNVCRFSLVLHCVISVAIPAGLADAQQAPTHDPTDDGKRVFKAANCMGGHKWHGHGGSGYGGDALSLRNTELTREQIIEVIRCGRPGTGMPFHLRGAYAEPCYDLKREPAPCHPKQRAFSDLARSKPWPTT
jgi:hypothetical protein